MRMDGMPMRRVVDVQAQRLGDRLEVRWPTVTKIDMTFRWLGWTARQCAGAEEGRCRAGDT